MTILQMAFILFVFHRALRIPREPVRRRAFSRCNSR
jgi:hypothetical protein